MQQKYRRKPARTSTQKPRVAPTAIAIVLDVCDCDEGVLALDVADGGGGLDEVGEEEVVEMVEENVEDGVNTIVVGGDPPVTSGISYGRQRVSLKRPNLDREASTHSVEPHSGHREGSRYRQIE